MRAGGCQLTATPGRTLRASQVKAVLRGEAPPFASGEIEGMMGQVGVCIREARRQEGLAARYWVVEYLRRQPRGKVWEGIVLRWIKDGETLGSVFLKEVRGGGDA